MATVKELEDLLISRGIKNLHDFGYPTVDRANIFTDYIYSQMFKSMLEGTIDEAPPSAESIKQACRNLIERIKPIEPEPKKKVKSRK